MPSSTNLGLPYIDANQNQKHVTHNAALQILDALVQIQVQSASLATPPASPADGQCWIPAAGATGAWTGKDLNLACWQSGVWVFFAPRPGYVAYNVAAGQQQVWTGAAWTPVVLPTAQSIGQVLPGGFVNRFRNGGLDVWQRGTSMAVTTAGAYTADGWMVVPAGAGCTAQQGSGRQTTKNSLQVVGAAGVTGVVVKQRIESLMAASLAGQTVTVQAQVFNNTGAAITPTLTVNRPGAQDNYGTVTADVSAAALQSCANGAWTRIATTFAANAAAYTGLEIAFDFGNNFGTAAKSIQITELDIRVTPGVAAGQNGAPPPPELRPAGPELALCQRYYQIITASFQFYGAGTGSSYRNTLGYTYATTMRATPTVTLGTVGASANCTVSINNATASATALSYDPTGVAPCYDNGRTILLNAEI